MGLDITAYSNIKFKLDYNSNTNVVDKLLDEYILIREQAFDTLDGLCEGWYVETDRTECIGFRAGSYSGYNHWRSHLTNLAFGVDPGSIWSHPREYKGKPFYELIHFSDCEGVIGPKTSAKLAKDFRTWLEKAKAFSKDTTVFSDKNDGEYWFDKYMQWMDAFELASDNGIVAFH